MFNPNFNPAQVMLGGPSGGPPVGGKSPYLNINPGPPAPEKNGPAARPNIPKKPTAPNIGAQAVRSSGAGPFDPAYRQDLATYAGGNFARPGGSLSFNPTGQLFGNPTGGGNAPLPGMPTDLLSQALGGQGVSAPATTAPVAPQKPWWQKMMEDGNMFGKGRFLGN